MITFTRHAKERAQERGIPQSVIDLVLMHGTVETQEDGTEKATLRASDKKAATHRLHRKLQLLDKASDVVVIMNGNKAITTYREFQ